MPCSIFDGERPAKVFVSMSERKLNQEKCFEGIV